MRNTTALADEIDTLLRQVLGAPDDGAQRAADTAASALTDPPERWPDVSRALLRLSDRVIGGCWARGWQPADLVRAARRGLEDDHTRLTEALITAEARRHGALEPRWAAQLDTTVWWRDDSTFLTEFGAERSLDRFALAGCFWEVVRLLARLPAIEAVTTPPGGRPRAAAPPRDEPRMLGRIRALLTKAESTQYAQEAEALAAKAQQLMARHSIDQALLSARTGGRDTPAACRIGVDNPYEEAKALLLDGVADANRCRTVWSSRFGFSTVVGFETDLDAVELLYTSLLVQAMTAMNRGRSRGKSFRQTFLIAYAGRIRERLAAAAGAAEAEERADDLLPVLATREVAVGDAAERLFPRTTTSRIRGARDQEGWERGEAAADGAALGPSARRIPPGR